MTRTQGGEWLVRIEDIDTPRVVPGAAGLILRTLESFGLYWDGPVVYQSRRLVRYQQALQALLDAGCAYPCSCSRQDVSRTAAPGAGGVIYPGTCRQGPQRPERPTAIRLRTEQPTIAFQDRIQGAYGQSLETAVGDFIIRRADGLFAYQLAVVVDDAAQGVTQVVRGCDLLDSTPRRLYLQRLLGLPTPGYSHLPVAVDRYGFKLSKQTYADPLNWRRPGPTLVAALRFLGQEPPLELAGAPAAVIWSWACAHWRPERIPQVPVIGWAPALKAAPHG